MSLGDCPDRPAQCGIGVQGLAARPQRRHDGTRVTLRSTPLVAVLAAVVLAAGCGLGGGPSDEELASLEPAATGALEEPGETSSVPETGQTETGPVDLVGPCVEALAPFTKLGTEGANAAAQAMVSAMCEQPAAQDAVAQSSGAEQVAAAFAGLLRDDPKALRPVCAAYARDAALVVTEAEDTERYLAAADRRRFVDATCRLLPDYVVADGFATTSLYGEHRQLVVPYCTALLLRVYDTRWSEERKARTPRPLFRVVATRSCRQGIRRRIIEVGGPTQIVFSDREAFQDLFSAIYEEERT